MPIPIILAHGSLGLLDDLIFLGVGAAGDVQRGQPRPAVPA